MRSNERIKAEVIAALAAGEQPAIVAERYGIDAAKVRMWKTRYVTPIVAQQPPQHVPQHAPIQPAVIERQQRIGELVIELLAAKLEASKAIAETAQSAEWRAKQSAGELAALGDYLDSSAFALGDRLAGRGQSDDGAD